MSNLNNGHVTGRLAADPRVFVNSDGSKSVHITLYVDRPYRDSDGNRPSDRVQLETWLRPETAFEKTPFGYMNTGDLVTLGFEIRSSVYADKHTGEVRYAQVLNVIEASLLESASTTTGSTPEAPCGRADGPPGHRAGRTGTCPPHRAGARDRRLL